MNLKLILTMTLSVVLGSCNSQKIDLEQIELNQPLNQYTNNNELLQDNYYMLSRKTGFRTDKLEKFKFGNVDLTNSPEYRMSEERVGDVFTSFVYFLHNNEDDKISTIAVESENTKLSQEILDYLFSTHGEPKIIGNPLEKPDAEGFIVQNVFYNWENPKKNGKGYYACVVYSKRNDQFQFIGLDLIIYDSNDEEYMKILESNN